eukprot:scaffold1033_cov205-Alexandrium_tamarense.AAC.14
MQRLIFINTPPPLSYQPYDCDTKTDSSVSEIIISKANLKSAINNVLTTGTTGGISFINSIGLAYDNFRDKNGNVVSGFGGKAFKWFCSGQVHEADTFGSGYGFVDRMYIFGEEADASAGYGRFFAIADKTMHMITGEGSGDASSIQGGRNGIEPDALENVAMVHTGEKDHVALMFSPDYGEKKLRMYIGKKGFKTDGTSCGACTADKDFLARNGLASLPTGGGTRTGSFGTNSGSAVTGTKLEDIDTNPTDPTKVVLAEQLTGVYELDFGLVFTNGVFSATSSSFTISKLPLSINSPDNVEWSADGSMFVCSDNSDGSVNRRSSSGVVTKIAATKGSGESSGIYDISELLDLDPASALLVNSMACPTSMSVIVNPLTRTATASPTNNPTFAEGQPTKAPTSEPSASPTKLCGNGVCDVGLKEEASVCQSDCGNKSLVTTTTGNNGAPGAAFDIKALQDVTITSFDFYGVSTNAEEVEVYTRKGSYSGNVGSPTGWALVFKKTVNQGGKDTLVGLSQFDSPVEIVAGDTQSFFIYTATSLMYEAGTSEGATANNDESLEVFEGVGIVTKFSGNINDIVSPRVFKGVIRYDVVKFESTSPTTLNPTSSPSIKPTDALVTASPTGENPSSSPTK